MDTVNGFGIIAQFFIPKGNITRLGRVIIVDRQSEYGRYVSAVQYGDVIPETGQIKFDKEWAHGHYCEKLEEAFVDFVDRVERHTGIKYSIEALREACPV